MGEGRIIVFLTRSQNQITGISRVTWQRRAVTDWPLSRRPTARSAQNRSYPNQLVPPDVTRSWHFTAPRLRLMATGLHFGFGRGAARETGLDRVQLSKIEMGGSEWRVFDGAQGASAAVSARCPGKRGEASKHLKAWKKSNAVRGHLPDGLPRRGGTGPA